MTDTNPQYRKLVKQLSGTRKTLTQACRDADINIEDIDDYTLQQNIDQCSHCNIWSTKLVQDLDDNPVCPVCVRLTGL